MTTFDFSPLFRSTIGFDRLTRLADAASRADGAAAYPPYNIEKTGEDSYRLSMAVAGFAPADLDVQSRGRSRSTPARSRRPSSRRRRKQLFHSLSSLPPLPAGEGRGEG